MVQIEYFINLEGNWKMEPPLFERKGGVKSFRWTSGLILFQKKSKKDVRLILNDGDILSKTTFRKLIMTLGRDLFSF